MTEVHHDWWSNLTPFEKASVRHHEKEIDRKQAILESLRGKKTARGLPSCVRTRERLRLEIAGHAKIRYEYQNRATQRARLGIKPRLTAKDRKRRFVSGDRPSVG